MTAIPIVNHILDVTPPFPEKVTTPASPSILHHMRWCPSLTGRGPDDRGLAKSPEIWQKHWCRHGQRPIPGPHAGTQTPWAIWSFPTMASKARWNAHVASARIAQMTKTDLSGWRLLTSNASRYYQYSAPLIGDHLRSYLSRRESRGMQAIA